MPALTSSSPTAPEAERAAGRAAAPGRRRAAPTGGAGTRIRPEDAFFLYNRTPQVPQLVGGAMILDSTEDPLTLRGLRELVSARLAGVPELNRVVRPGSRLRYPRWVPQPADVAAHVVIDHRAAGRGLPGLRALVAEAAGRGLPLSRPPWQMVLCPGLAPDTDALLVLAEHVLVDGIAFVALIDRLLTMTVGRRPIGTVPRPAARRRGPSWRGTLGVAQAVRGVAQLAADGTVPPGPFAGPFGPRRGFGTAVLPLATVRAVARATRTQPTDVVLGLVGAATAAGLPAGAADRPLRLAVPVAVGSDAGDGEGNRTSALWVDVPLAAAPAERIRAVAASRARRAESARVAGARFAMTRLARLLPPAAAPPAARAAYQGAFFHGIASMMPGPPVRAQVGTTPAPAAYPILPLARSVGLAVGVLRWGPALCVGVTAAADVVPDSQAFAAAVAASLEALAGELVPAAR